MRAAGIVGALVLLGAACSSDDKPSNGDGDNNDGDGEDNGVDVSGEEDDIEPEDAGTRMDSSRPDARIDTPPAADAGDAGTLPPVKLPDGSTTPVAPPDAAVINSALTPLPNDGERGSLCYTDTDCKGDDLKCQLPVGSVVPGFCVDDCASDADCEAIDGVKGKCGALVGEGLCQYPCGGAKNDGKGACPEDMVCANFATGVTASIFPDWRCRFPEGGGKKTEKPYTQCDPFHLGGDCEGPSWCTHPTLSVSTEVLTTDFCSPICTRDADCKSPDEGTTARSYCEPITRTCQFDCSNKGARCPTGMNCMDIDPSQVLITMRCVLFN